MRHVEFDPRTSNLICMTSCLYCYNYVSGQLTPSAVSVKDLQKRSYISLSDCMYFATHNLTCQYDTTIKFYHHIAHFV